jgi:type II restriction/modification system DNA methylase subunit YeeA
MAGEDVSGWGVAELGAFRERLLKEDERASGGVWYTPPELADFMTRFSIAPVLDRLADATDPASVLDVLALDPACGAGVFLVSAARLIANRYAGLIAKAEPTDWMVAHVMPEVLSECVFGVDIDPVAVDLAKSALWLEIDGVEPITFMDRNVICGDALDQDSPPKLEERLGSPPDLAEAS